jgi:hypothetical protein
MTSISQPILADTKNRSHFIADWTADALALASRINERLRPTAGKIVRKNKRHILNDHRCLALAGFDDIIHHHNFF